MDDLSLTLDLVEALQWRAVLLGRLSKRPSGDTWSITQHTGVIFEHIKSGGNVGLLCGPDSRVAVLDFDTPGTLAEMSAKLGPLRPWVETRKGHHCYVAWEDGLPPKFHWNGHRAGEVQRGGPGVLQQVVMPPSLHPETRLPYRWVIQGITPLDTLPPAWRDHLLGSVIPNHITLGDLRGQPEAEVWDGPPADELTARALRQPGASRRRYGTKFQCPACRREGHDKHRDNAVVYNDGRWGCAYDSKHSADIGAALGVAASLRREVLGDSESDLRDVSLDDLD